MEDWQTTEHNLVEYINSIIDQVFEPKMAELERIVYIDGHFRFTVAYGAFKGRRATFTTYEKEYLICDRGLQLFNISSHELAIRSLIKPADQIKYTIKREYWKWV